MRRTQPAMATTITAIRAGLLRCRTAAAVAMSSAGSASTQWWDHEIGETSSPVTAHSAKPYASCPARPAIAASTMPATATTTAIGSQAGLTSSVCSVRASAPSRLWLATFWIRPTRAGLSTVVCQYCAASPGTARKEAATVTANAPPAVAAARYRRVASR
jgi:hypothetical protein